MHVFEWLWRWWGYVPADEMSVAWQHEQRRLAPVFDGVSWRWPIDKAVNEVGRRAD